MKDIYIIECKEIPEGNVVGRRIEHLGKDSVSFDAIYELASDLPLQDVIEKASKKPAVVFEGLQRYLFCNIVCGISHL